MFIGQYRYNLDDKGRLVIPQDYRSELGPRIVINKGIEKCITIYPLDVWKNIVDSMSNMSLNQKDTRTYNRYYMSSAFYKDFDSQGRITIDEVLRKYADISKSCVVTGANSIIEIWSVDEWEKIENARETEFGPVSEKMVFRNE